MTILITGASGFIGSFIVEEALRRGFETWAGVRRTSSRRYLSDERIHFVELDMSSEEVLVEQLRGHCFDYVVHAAGVTKCKKSEEFYRVNCEGTKHLATALLRLEMPIKKFVFLSSLSVFGAVRESFTEIQSTDTPSPNTHYGRSKLMAEEALSNVAEQLKLVVLRPTGVYGPREKDYFLVVKSIARGMDFGISGEKRLTFVYVSDLVNAVFLALERGEVGQKYFVSDGEQYDADEFSHLVEKALGVKHVMHIKLPLPILRMVCGVCDFCGRLSGKVTALNNDKFQILAQRNWLCDISTTTALGYHPHVMLAEGVRETINWYKKEGWV